MPVEYIETVRVSGRKRNVLGEVHSRGRNLKDGARARLYMLAVSTWKASVGSIPFCDSEAGSRETCYIDNLCY
jgi:hypothetical protein